MVASHDINILKRLRLELVLFSKLYSVFSILKSVHQTLRARCQVQGTSSTSAASLHSANHLSTYLTHIFIPLHSHNFCTAFTLPFVILLLVQYCDKSTWIT